MTTLLLAAALAAQAGTTLDEFYKFKPETMWVYQRFEGGDERKIIGRAISEVDGKTKLEWKEYEKDGSTRDTSTVTWAVADGVLTAEARKEGDENVLSFGILKEGAKKGDSWTATLGEFTHQGTAEVTVPSGTYKNATWTRLKADETKIDFYLVPKVGLVKVEIHSPGGGGVRIELAEFKEPKK